jgi:hypothetical protein
MTSKMALLKPSELKPVLHDDFTIVHRESNLIEATMTAQAEKRGACYITPSEVPRYESEEQKRNRLTAALELMKAQFLAALEENKRQRTKNALQESTIARRHGVVETDINQNAEWLRKARQLRATSRDGWGAIGTSKAEMLLNDHRATLVEVMNDTYGLKKKMWKLWAGE